VDNLLRVTPTGGIKKMYQQGQNEIKKLTRSKWSRRRFLIGGGVLAGSVALTACGSTTPSATNSTSAIVPGASSSPIGAANTVSKLGQKVSIKVGFMPYTDHIAVPLVADKISQDFKYGEVKTEKFQAWKPGLEKLKTGELDVMFTFVPPLFTRFGSGDYPAKVVLLAHRNGLYVFSKKGLIKPQDLKGKIFAVPDKQSNYYVMAAKYVKDAGLTYDGQGADVKFVELPLNDMGNALRNGDIDAFIQSGPQSSVLQKQGVGQVLDYSYSFAPNHLDCVVLMRNEVIQKYPDAAQEFVTGIRKAISDFGLDQKNKSGIEDKLRLAAQLAAPSLNADSEAVFNALKDPEAAIIYSDPEPKLKEFQDLQADWKKIAPIGDSPQVDMSAIIETKFAK
jgi:NitT/TauT family transport system substrate-binding protein